MRATLIAWAIALAAVLPATAGPWPRGKGQTFLAFGYEATVDRYILPLDVEHALTAYGEFGVSPRLTFVLDANRYVIAKESSIVATMRYTLTQPDTAHQFAISAGFGTETGFINASSIAVVGASWGRGFETRFGGGWGTLDLQHRAASENFSYTKLDATLGLRPIEGSIVYAQLQYAYSETGFDTLRLSTSYVRDLNERLKAEIGLLYGIKMTMTLA